MRILVTSADPAILATIQQQLTADLGAADLHRLITVTPIESPESTKAPSGRMMGAILVTAVGAGGAGTVLMGELGKFAPVLEAYVQREDVQISVEKADGTKIEMDGNARYIEKLLNRILQDEASSSGYGQSKP